MQKKINILKERLWNTQSFCTAGKDRERGSKCGGCPDDKDRGDPEASIGVGTTTRAAVDVVTHDGSRYWSGWVGNVLAGWLTMMPNGGGGVGGCVPDEVKR
jgi:hypothetical protein